MADLNFLYTTDDTEYTQGSIAWSEKVALASSGFTAGNTYCVIVSCRFGQSNGSGAIALFEDGSNLTKCQHSSLSRVTNGNTGYSYNAMYLHTSPGTPVDVGVGIYTAGGSWTAYLDDTTILAFDLDSLDTGDYYTSEDTGTTSLTTSWADYNTLTFTPANSGDKWLIIANVTGTVDSAFREPQMRLYLDNTTVLAQTIVETNTTNPDGDAYWNAMLIAAVELDDSEHTIDIQLQEISAANEYENSTIVAIRLSAFEDAAFDYNGSVATGNPVEIAGLSAFTPTSDGDVIVIGGGSCDDNDNNTFNGVNMTIDGTIAPVNHNNWETEQIDDVAEPAHYRIAVHSGTASTPIDIDVDGYQEDSVGQFENTYAIAFTAKLVGVGGPVSGTILPFLRHLNG